MVMFQSSLPPVEHKMALQLAAKECEDTPHERVPWFILSDQAVWEKVLALLGPLATADVCRHVHIVESGSQDGDWHTDNYDDQPWPDAHEWGILMYFPQELTLDMGGTSILGEDGNEVIAVGPAGTCLLARGDVMHRARANTSGKTRYMLKYLFRPR